jgi:hypothetical protein
MEQRVCRKIDSGVKFHAIALGLSEIALSIPTREDRYGIYQSMPTKIGDKIGGTNFALALSDLPVPAGTTDNSPAIHCRDRGPVRPRVPAGTTEGLPRRCLLSSLRDFAPPPDSTPAMNCRAIVCRPHGTMAQKKTWNYAIPIEFSSPTF